MKRRGLEGDVKGRWEGGGEEEEEGVELSDRGGEEWKTNEGGGRLSRKSRIELTRGEDGWYCLETGGLVLKSGGSIEGRSGESKGLLFVVRRVADGDLLDSTSTSSSLFLFLLPPPAS